MTYPAAAPLDLPQSRNDLANRIPGVETHDQVDEVGTLETDRSVSIGAGDTKPTEAQREQAQRFAQISLRIDVAPGGDENAREGCRAHQSAGLGQIARGALDDHAHVARPADRARLVERQADPVELEFLEHHERDVLRKRLDQVKL